MPLPERRLADDAAVAAMIWEQPLESARTTELVFDRAERQHCRMKFVQDALRRRRIEVRHGDHLRAGRASPRVTSV